MFVVLVDHGISEWFRKHEIQVFGPFTGQHEAEALAHQIREGEYEPNSVTGRVEGAVVMSVQSIPVVA